MKRILFTLISFIMGQCLVYCQTDLLINEVLYYQDITDTIHDKDHEWLELYNKGINAVNVENWTISNRTGLSLATIPNIEIPSGAYLVIHFKQGIDDLDFSDNLGHYFTQDNHLTTDVFSETADEIACYNGNPAMESIVDFMVWNAEAPDFTGGVSYDYAVSAGIWTTNEFFNAKNTSGHTSDKVQRVLIGTSIGRDKDSNDFDLPQDWATDGGINAIEMTPGQKNFSDLQIIFPPPPPPPSPKEWTFMVYLNGDNDLEKSAWKDLNEMEIVDANDQVNVVVMVDWSPGYSNIKVSFDNGQTFAPTDSTYRGFLLKDLSNTPKKRVTLYPVAGDNPSLGEKNMGDPAVLTEFIQWGMTKFPANKYAVVLWDHGNGWKAHSFDDTSIDELHIGELNSALNPIPEIIDLIGFDQCLMAMVEVAYQVYADADVMVASEDVILDLGWPYDNILKGLKSNPGWTGKDLGKKIVTSFNTFYQQNTHKDPDRTISAIALNNKFLDLISDVSDFGEELTTGVEDYKKHYRNGDNVQLEIQSSLLATRFFYDPNYIDMAHFAQLVKNNAGIPNSYKSKAPKIFNNLLKGAGIVLAEKHGPTRSNAHGLSIYFPIFQTKYANRLYSPTISVASDPYDDPTFSFAIAESAGDRRLYASDPDDCFPMPNPENHPFPPTPNFLFPQDTKWDEFLHRYYEPVADAGADIVVFEGQSFFLIGSGSSDADGIVTKYYWDVDEIINSDANDYDKDCVDEANDDADLEGEIVMHTYWLPGDYCVTLTTWDDHHLQAGHADHKETDQDEVKVHVLPIYFDSVTLCREVVSGGAAQLIAGTSCFDWTLGEWMIETHSPTGDLALCQGFHQGYETIISIDEKFEEVDIHVFPNPTEALVNIRSGYQSPMKVELIDISGKILKHKVIEPLTEIESIDVSQLPSAIYILRFQNEDGKLLSSYKIHKTN